ncbi:indole-3-glycerol phosphate synthase TrpC [Staphylococcus debuckii]|uniref:indole-3-glycerol phosphate synthase TrpC n=1 Tax=Staphylococcus debuckii TaxID=2044912 RepID=UPI000F43799A|nr:indole-3-glycerol phosphate synthase TrpC [Staphylococcus debuckii]AYU55187.1 indole-3-glycerol phosphate synthase TrpC [Staphylococcus debuckii]
MTILDDIVAYKKELLEDGYYDDLLRSLPFTDVRYKKKLSMRLAERDHLSVIAEIKSKSPSVPVLPNRDLSKQAKEYEEYGAQAISVLTDEYYFGGSYERLNQLTQETSLPVLCKDFMIEPIQIDVAYKAGASVILLIVNILTDEQMHELYQYAKSLGLDVLVEVHSKQELRRAYDLHPEIIGVNNRDLTRFVTNVEHTNEILERKRKGFYYISESGIHNKEDVEKIVGSGIDGILVGESLMKCDNLAEFLPSLQLKKE